MGDGDGGLVAPSPSSDAEVLNRGDRPALSLRLVLLCHDRVPAVDDVAVHRGNRVIGAPAVLDDVDVPEVDVGRKEFGHWKIAKTHFLRFRLSDITDTCLIFYSKVVTWTMFGLSKP